MLNGPVVVGLDLALAVDGSAQRIYHAAQHGVTDADAGALAGADHAAAFLDLDIAAEQNDADAVGAHILHHALDAGVEDDDLAIGGVVNAVDAGDAVAYGLDSSDLLELGVQIEVLDLCLQDGDDALFAGGLDRAQPLLELSQTALGAPFILLVAGSQLEAADQRGIFLHLKDDAILAVAVGDELLDAVQLLLGGSGDIAQRDIEVTHTLLGQGVVEVVDLLQQIQLILHAHQLQKVAGIQRDDAVDDVHLVIHRKGGITQLLAQHGYIMENGDGVGQRGHGDVEAEALLGVVFGGLTHAYPPPSSGTRRRDRCLRRREHRPPWRWRRR